MTEKLGHAPIPMRRVDPGPGSLEDAGDFYWQVTPVGGKRAKRDLVLALPIPEGFRGKYAYSRWTIDHPNIGGHRWSWNGDEDKPTLSPSLHAVDQWHGFIKDGVMTEA